MTWRILNNEIRKKVLSQIKKCHNEGAYIQSVLYRHWQKYAVMRPASQLVDMAAFVR